MRPIGPVGAGDDPPDSKEETPMPTAVGFIGLGNMGRPMAANLVKAGFALVVHDIDPARVEPLRAQGAAVAGTPEAVARAAGRTICMVETTAQTEAVIAGERGIAGGAASGHLVVCMSTIDPLVARRLGAALAGQGVGMLDAPVSGGTERAISGELSVIVGGPADTVEACRDLFQAMGRRVFHVGDLGQGLAMKLVNNMLVQVNTVAVAEALVLAVKAGLDPRTAYEVVRASTGTSYAWETRVPRILDRDFSPGGTVDISFKDQELETAFAKQLGVPVLLANVSQQVYQMARAAGLGKEDGSAIVKVLERLAAVHVA
jgi:3-hydroxyisobutyrate dehydrogenase